MLSSFKKIITRPNIAIDLGTANTRIYKCEHGIIFEEPSLVKNIRQDENNKNEDAYVAYLNSKLVSSPMQGGVIIDLNTAVKLLKPLFGRVHRGIRKPISLACAPSDTSIKERKLLAEAILRSGSSQVALIPEPFAAAVGAGIDLMLPSTRLLIDLGEGVTDMAVIRKGRFIFASALRIACSDIHKALRKTIISRHKVFLYSEEIERLTHEIETSFQVQTDPHKAIRVKGIDIVKKCEVDIGVTSEEVTTAVAPVISKILETISVSLQKLPENIFCELSDSGICLTGGGSLIKGIDRLISMKTNLKVTIPPDPVHAVINGAIKTLLYWKEKESWWEKVSWPFGPSASDYEH